MRREYQLDGLRGIAAMVVAIFHFLRSFAPATLGADHVANFTPLSILWNGHFAVVVFFALSGLLFFRKFYEESPGEGVFAGVKRYVRLTIPVLAVSLAGWVLHVNGLFFNRGAAALTGSDWLPRWFDFAPSLSFAAAEPVLWMYASFSCNYTYNCNLWTIRYELFVVWLVIALGVAMRFVPRRYHWFMLAAAMAMVLGTQAFAFLAGAAVALFVLSNPRSRADRLGGIVLLGCIALGSFHSVVPRVAWLWPLAAAGIVWGVERVSSVRSFLSNRACRFLGDLSFGTYLIHFLTLSSVASWIFLQTRSVLVTFIAYALSTIVAAWLFSLAVEKPLMGLLARWRTRGGSTPPVAIPAQRQVSAPDPSGQATAPKASVK